MSEREYSRVYHEIAGDTKFADIYPDKAALGWWLTLLVIADQAYPNPAHLPYGINESVLARLTQRDIVRVTGSMFRMKGLDAERRRRAKPARDAANKRWEDERNANALDTPTADAMQTHTEGNASQAKPSQVQAESKPSQAEQDALGAYYDLKGGQVSEGAISMLNEMVTDHGEGAVIRELGAEAKRSSIDRQFLSRVKANLAINAERQSKAAERARKQADADYQRQAQQGRDAMTPEQQAKADEAMAAAAAAIGKGMPA